MTFYRVKNGNLVQLSSQPSFFGRNRTPNENGERALAKHIDARKAELDQPLDLPPRQNVRRVAVPEPAGALL
jgi:hypothetical protein